MKNKMQNIQLFKEKRLLYQNAAPGEAQNVEAQQLVKLDEAGELHVPPDAINLADKLFKHGDRIDEKHMDALNKTVKATDKMFIKNAGGDAKKLKNMRENFIKYVGKTAVEIQEYQETEFNKRKVRFGRAMVTLNTQVKEDFAQYVDPKITKKIEDQTTDLKEAVKPAPVEQTDAPEETKPEPPAAPTLAPPVQGPEEPMWKYLWRLAKYNLNNRKKKDDEKDDKKE